MMNRTIALGLVGLALLGCESAKQLKACEEAVAKLPKDVEDAERLRYLDPLWFEARKQCGILADGDSDLAPKGKEYLDVIQARYDAIEPALLAKGVARNAARREARAEALDGLRSKTKVRWIGRANEPNDDCVSKGLPQYHLEYTGGTYEQNQSVAYADGCKHSAYQSEHLGMMSPSDNRYCCPGTPRWR